MSDHPEVRLKAADYALFGVYQDWVHQNPRNHLDDVIKEDSKWQDMLVKLACFPTQRYDVPSGRVGKFFVSILSVELDGIQAWKWNANLVIVFQLFILQRVLLVMRTT